MILHFLICHTLSQRICVVLQIVEAEAAANTEALPIKEDEPKVRLLHRAQYVH